ncbi:MAG: alcohol dehydrogenase catalytic domain-containing protein [Candidatus Marinimicrobia bacterium]|nr:alcohol dehydrogenase catalytic domain-containing protein [Candidatus Neomarinimicrobiota bacterium]
MLAVTKPKPETDKDWKTGFDVIDMPETILKDSGEVLIEVSAGAICGTDVGIYNSKDSIKKEMMLGAEVNPIIIGHEFAGKVVDLGEDALEFLSKKFNAPANSDFKNRIFNDYDATAEMHITCGSCLQCRIGEKHVCKNTLIKGIHLHGAFTKYISVPAENLVLLKRGEIPLDVISFMDAIGNAVHTTSTIDKKGKTIAILGCGIQGLMATAISHQLGAKKIIVTDASHPKTGMTNERLESTHFEMARKFGADACFDMAISENRENFFDFVMEETDGIGVDGVLEMSGNYKAYEDAFRVIRAGGIFALLGLPSGDFHLDFARDIIFKGVTVKGIIGRRIWETWDTMIDLLKNGLSDMFVDNGFVTHRLKISEFETAFTEIAAGNALKVLLKPE